MPALTHLLVQFIFRLTLGLALAMGLTNARLVTSGYYRVHLWVLMGLNTLASLAIYSDREYDHWATVFALAMGLTIASYAGAILWLYERSSAGTLLLYGIAIASLVAAALALRWPATTTSLGYTLGMLDLASGGWLLGVTMAAMLLGHWYLNTPTMELVPLKRLVLLMALAIVLRTAVSAAGLGLNLAYGEPLELAHKTFIALRWLSGLLGTGTMALMTWYVLKVPNTQSATGILYAGVILSFIGELASQLLSVETLYPL
jgi:hypothetical protein